MAMTKVEKAALAGARTEAELARRDLGLARALRWTDRPHAEAEGVPHGEPSGGYREGWVFVAAGGASDRVEIGWTESHRHGWGRHSSKPRSAAQDGRPVFPTRLDALVGLRRRVERECAERLLRIDRMIEAEAASPTSMEEGEKA